MIRGVRAGVATIFLCGIVGGAGFRPPSVAAQIPPPQTSRPGLGDINHGEESFPGRLAEQAARSRNSDRQKRLVADADKLLSLATDLKVQVDKTDKNMLSVDVVKRAEEIEKLAHSVKERMKGGG